MVVNFILQGKGGVGKSLVASLIAQYQLENKKRILCIDTDPVNSTFSGYRGFKVERLELLKGSKIDESQFDELMETIVKNKSKEIVIDNGASSFIPLSAYLVENDALSVLAEMDIEVNLHTVITGGQAIDDTMSGLSALLSSMGGKANIIVWLNHYFGDIEKHGKTFDKMKLYTSNKDKIKGLVEMPQQSDLFKQDIQLMLEKKLTFQEAKAHKDFKFMAKNRLEKTKVALFEQLDTIYAEADSHAGQK